MPFTAKEKNEIVSRYLSGESPADISPCYGVSRSVIKEVVRRLGRLRSQAEASKLACARGKKRKAQDRLVLAAKTWNRFHPGKRHTLRKVCEACSVEYTATSVRQKRCSGCCPDKTWRQIYSRYGITKARWENLLLSQGGTCALCPSVPSVIDHDHATGAVRGLLCNSCNLRLSAVDDRVWLAKAKAYVARGVTLALFIEKAGTQVLRHGKLW